MTRDWLLNHSAEETTEIISYNNELETQLKHTRTERDELALLNETLKVGRVR